MVVSGNFNKALPHREALTVITGDVFGRTEIVGGRGVHHGPHAYLVDQSPNVVLPPHFHMSDQFQVVVRGTGSLGRHNALKPVTVHYARAQSAYGPIRADSEGLAYLTLRAVVDNGAHYLMDPKTKVDRAIAKFQTTGESAVPADLAVLASLTAVEQRALIPEDVDGLAAWLFRLPAGSHPVLPSQHEHAGRFHVVVGGTVLVGGDALPPWSCIWISTNESSSAVVAGAGGAELLSLQFPCKGSRHIAESGASTAFEK